MINGLIFDVDGVLLDSLSLWNALGEKYVLKNGYEPVKDMRRIIAEMSMKESAEWIRKTYGLHKESVLIIHELEEMLQSFYRNDVKMKPGVMELLTFLDNKGIPSVAATSGMKALTIEGMHRNGIDSYITKVITEEDVGKDKHHPDIFEMAWAHLKTAKKETMVVEDSLYALKTAHEAGFLTVGMMEPNNQKDREEIKETADFYCCSMYELKEVIKNENSINNSRK